MNGDNFVKTLFSLGYPEASGLKPRDFDWMFDDTQEFLQFFCSLGAHNVLSDEEEHLYRTMVESGKPILNELELDELERDGVESDVEEDVAAAGESLQELQQELESLRRQKRLGHQRLLQLHNMKQQCAEKASALSTHGQCDGGDETDVSMAKAVAKENVATNVVLRNLQGEVRKLQSLVFTEGGAVETQQEYLQMERQQSQRSAALLSKLPLDGYLQQVQSSHHSIIGHYKVRFTLDGEEREMDDERREAEAVVERKNREVARLQATLMSVQGLLVQARAEEAGALAAKEWLSQQRWPSAEPLPPDPDAIPVVPSDRRLALLRQYADGLCLPLLREDAHRRAESVQRRAGVQEGLQGALLHQQAQLQVLQALLCAERDAQARALAHMKGVARGLAEEAARVTGGAAELRCRQETVPRSQGGADIGGKDPIIKGLLAFLEAHEETAGCSDCLTELAGLSSAQKAELNQLGGAKGEAEAEVQSLVRSLEKDCEALRQAALSEDGQAKLSPKVQHDVSEALREAEKQIGPLFKQLQEMGADLSSRRSQLQRSATLRRERELYVLFHLDPSQLSSVLEDCESSE
ncbi:hypothetical protein ACEWY4_025024 [Coilia grayii]|uniref:HAUS augmin-like complex subunit 3 N-terminal domain-containing protein n=1 Tax=Coilia grayii TaxID=363190 RepID=A0ABD1IWD4_9TELE